MLDDLDPEASSIDLTIDCLLVVVVLLSLGSLLATSLLFLSKRLSLGLAKGPDAVCWSWELADAVCDLSTTNQRRDDTGSDDKGEHETVHRVPGWSPTALGGSAVGVVQEVERQKLRDESVLDWQEDCWPSDCRCHNTNSVTWVTLDATVLCELETPVNSTEEGDDLERESVTILKPRRIVFSTHHGTVANL